MERRTFLARSGAAAGVAGLAGCSSVLGGSELRLAFQAPAATVDINTWYATREVADERGGVEPGVDVFEGADLAVNSVLSGDAHVARGSATAAATLADAGKEFRFLAAPVRSTDYVLVAREGIDSLSDIVEQDAVVGMSAPTGLDAVQTAALLFEEGVIDSVDELNSQRVGYSSARQAAIKEGSIDVSPQHYAQWLSMRETDAPLQRLATFGETLDQWIQETYMAPTSVIEERHDELVELLAAQLVANDRLYGDFDRYAHLVSEYVDGGGPDEGLLRNNYEFLTNVEVWPRDGGLDREKVDYVLDLSDRVGLTENRIPTDGMMDRGPLEEALQRVHGEDDTATGG